MRRGRRAPVPRGLAMPSPESPSPSRSGPLPRPRVELPGTSSRPGFPGPRRGPGYRGGAGFPGRARAPGAWGARAGPPNQRRAWGARTAGWSDSVVGRTNAPGADAGGLRFRRQRRWHADESTDHRTEQRRRTMGRPGERAQLPTVGRRGPFDLAISDDATYEAKAVRPSACSRGGAPGLRDGTSSCGGSKAQRRTGQLFAVDGRRVLEIDATAADGRRVSARLSPKARLDPRPQVRRPGAQRQFLLPKRGATPYNRRSGSGWSATVVGGFVREPQEVTSSQEGAYEDSCASFALWQSGTGLPRDRGRRAVPAGIRHRWTRRSFRSSRANGMDTHRQVGNRQRPPR